MWLHWRNYLWRSTTRSWCYRRGEREDRISDIHPCLLDLVRIGVLSINENDYDGVVGVLVIGLQMTFFITTVMAPGCYIMLEICSVALPKDFTQIRSYIAQMEDLLPVFQYCDSCTYKSGINEENKRSMMDSSVFEIIASTRKNRKRLCNIVYNHNASSPSPLT